MYVRGYRNPRSIYRVRLRFTRTKNNKTFRVLQGTLRQHFQWRFALPLRLVQPKIKKKIK